MSITRVNADSYETDVTSVGGRKLSIKMYEDGLFYINIEGPGGRPAITEEKFTSLGEARKALSAYYFENRGQIEKMKMIEEIAGPRPHQKKKNIGRSSDTE